MDADKCVPAVECRQMYWEELSAEQKADALAHALMDIQRLIIEMSPPIIPAHQHFADGNILVPQSREPRGMDSYNQSRQWLRRILNKK